MCRSLEPLTIALFDCDKEAVERTSELQERQSTDDIVSHSRRQSYGVVDAQSTSPPSRSIAAALQKGCSTCGEVSTRQQEKTNGCSAAQWIRIAGQTCRSGIQSVWFTAVIMMFFRRRSYEDLVTKTKQLATRPENEQQDESVVLWLVVVVRCTLRYFERSVMACDSIVEQTELGKNRRPRESLHSAVNDSTHHA